MTTPADAHGGERWFADPWNPTPEELCAWACDPAARWPVQDWPLAVAMPSLAPLVLELASDDGCGQRRFFVEVLYFLVGDAVHGTFGPEQRRNVERYLELARDVAHEDVVLWRRRTMALLEAPATFDYELWCGGGHARRSE